MQKYIYSVALVLSSALFSFGQISITIQGQSTELAGASHVVTAGNGNEQVVDLLIHNNTGATQEWGVSRKRIDVPGSGWTDFLCWGDVNDQFGGTCYGASQMNTNPWFTPNTAFIANGGSGLMIVHIDPSNTTAGYARYRYYVGRTVDNPQDSVDVEVNLTLATKEIKSNTISLTTYPNPADESMTLTLASGQAEATVRMTDVLGKVVLEDKVTVSKKFDVSELKNGVYVISVVSNGVTQTKRFVIRH